MSGDEWDSSERISGIWAVEADAGEEKCFETGYGVGGDGSAWGL